MSKKAFICLAVVALLATTATAVPVTLLTGELTKFKYTNYENWLDLNNNNVIDAGDKFFGILKTTSISNTTESKTLSGQLLNKELTGVFRFTVVGNSFIIPGGAGHLDFALIADGTDYEGIGIQGDFLNYYVGTGATMNWNPADANDDYMGGNGIVDAIDYAMDGLLWTSTAPGTFYEGINDTIINPVGLSVNRNWADFTVNNTGYKIIPQLFPEAIPLPGSIVHTYLGVVHNAGHVVDYYFETKLQGSDLGNWMFRSEDPAWLRAVPEPGTFVLLGGGILGLGLLRLRRRRK